MQQSLNVLYTNKKTFLNHKRCLIISLVKNSVITNLGLDPDPDWIRSQLYSGLDPDPAKSNTDPKNWSEVWTLKKKTRGFWQELWCPAWSIWAWPGPGLSLGSWPGRPPDPPPSGGGGGGLPRTRPSRRPRIRRWRRPRRRTAGCLSSTRRPASAAPTRNRRRRRPWIRRWERGAHWVG